MTEQDKIIQELRMVLDKLDRHAYWKAGFIQRGDTAVLTWVCSDCGAERPLHDGEYCPHCGARMDKWSDEAKFDTSQTYTIKREDIE